MSFIPSDFEAYFGGQWVAEHGQNGKSPSNSGVDSLISNLRAEVSRLGRDGRWQPQTGQGNPLVCSSIQALARGHHNTNKEQQHVAKAAKPWTHSDILAAVEHIDAALKTAKGMLALLLHRDVTILCLLWETHCRGANAGSFRRANLRDQAGNPPGCKAKSGHAQVHMQHTAHPQPRDQEAQYSANERNVFRDNYPVF